MISNAMNSIQNVAHSVAPAYVKEAPVMSPSMRGKMASSSSPLGNDMLSSAAHMISDLKSNISNTVFGPALDERGIPIPPPMPTQEKMHKHYLIPEAPPMPTQEKMHGHYLIPKAPPMPTAEQMNKHYMSRNKTLENASNMVRSVFDKVADAVPSAADLGLATRLDANGIPVPPPMPTQEKMHKHYLIPKAPPMPTQEKMHGHYLIPKAPPMPTAEQMNKHYLSRDRTLENASNILRSLYTRVSNAANDLKATVPSAADLGLATRLDANGIPIPPPMPTQEKMHKHYLIPKAPPMPTQEKMHGHYLIPRAPPMPTAEQMNKHYMSRNKTLENAKDAALSYVNYASEVAQDLKSAAISGAASIVPSSSSVPVPPPQPTQEQLHKHFLSRPVVRSNRALPSDMTENERQVVRDLYASPQQETTSAASPLFSLNKVKRFANSFFKLPGAATQPMSSQSHIPVPPRQPTREDMHRHYLIPLAPPQPKMEDLNRHYLSRDRTMENASSFFSHAVSYVAEVATEVKDYLTETPITDMPHDLKERMNAKPLDVNGVPIPPRQPTREDMHRHYLVPLAPPQPKKGQMHRHYLSRDKSLEKAGDQVKSAANYVAEVAEDVTRSIADTAAPALETVTAAAAAVPAAVAAVPEVAARAGDSVASAVVGASEKARETLSGAVDTVMESSGLLDNKKSAGVVYNGNGSVSESPIFKKKTGGMRKIVPRSDYSGFKPLLRSNANAVRI